MYDGDDCEDSSGKIKFKMDCIFKLETTNLLLTLLYLCDNLKIYFVGLPDASEKAVSNWHSDDQGKLSL